MTTFNPRVYVGPPDSGDYFTGILPAEVPDFVQRISVDEGQDETRPFQRARSPRASVRLNLDGGSRPFEAGHLCVIQVETVDGIEEWFRGILTTPKYDNVRHGRTLATVNALHTMDRLRRNITVSIPQLNQDVATNLGMVFDAAGWPDTPIHRVISNSLDDVLSLWEVDNQPALRAAENLLNTAGPPARIIPQRNGGIVCVRSVGGIAGGSSFSSADIVDEYDFVYDDRSLINQVIIDGTAYVSTQSTSEEVREPGSTFGLLPGLLPANAPMVARRVFDTYERGLTFLTFNLIANDSRVYNRAKDLQLGSLVSLAADGNNYPGYVATLRWAWESTVARVRVGIVVKGNILSFSSVDPKAWLRSAFRPMHKTNGAAATPAGQLSTPTGLSLTESTGDITANWDAVADATGYVLEWREEGSGAAWQTVNVATPPHTFTP